MIDGETACREGIVLVLAADQKPFHVGSESGTVNRFCVLRPLMTLDGDELDRGPAGFPNRGCVWWMIREEIRDERVEPGSLWTAAIQDAAKWEVRKSDSDRYQVRMREIQPGGAGLIEILPLPEDDPDMALLHRQRKLPWPRPTTPQVILRGRKTVLGPLRATWSPETRQLEFQPPLSSSPEVLRLHADRFRETVREERFHLEVNQHDPTIGTRAVEIALTRVDWLNLDQLREHGEILDASTDSQVLNWAIRHYRITRTAAAPVKDFFSRVAEGDLAVQEPQATQKLSHLTALQADAERVLELGEAVSAQIASLEPFQELVKSHLDAIVARDVSREIEARRAQIEAAVQSERRQLDAVRADLKSLSTEFEKRAAAQDEELKTRQAVRLRELEQREKLVSERERAVTEQEDTVYQRLERVIARYQGEAEKVGDALVAQLPILRRIGMDQVSGQASSPAASEPCPLRLPAYLHEARPPDFEPIDEAMFVSQFQRVVERRGYQYALEDLLNVHVCVKTGGLTVLAGPSGTGKSSLPQLYAEALGWADRYLAVPVRPDWLDDRDFIGAYNALARRFEPSNSGVADRLIEATLDAQRGLGGIYLVCLDEMNLARVEHYFAQFLSVLERPLDKRQVILFPAGLARADDPYSPYQVVRVGANVRILGTVNIDETTHFFSPKVLDRSQVVSFAAPDLSKLTATRDLESVGGILPVPLTLYDSWNRPAEDRCTARDFLVEIVQILRRSQLVLGVRQFQRMLRYVASAHPFLAEDAALDFQIVQVILPRLRRTAPQFDETLQTLREKMPPGRFPRSAEILRRLADMRVEHDYFQLLGT